MDNVQAVRRLRPLPWALAAGLVLLLAGVGIATWWPRPPVPLELLRHVEELEVALWKAQAPTIFPARYQRFRTGLTSARVALLTETQRLSFWQDLDEVERTLRDLKTAGASLVEASVESQAALRQDLEAQREREVDQVARLRMIAQWFDLGRDAQALSHSHALLQELQRYLTAGDLVRARETLRAATTHLRRVERHALDQMRRYSDGRVRAKWQRWVRETARLSQASNQAAFVVLKAEARLRVYEAGRLSAEFPVHLGYHGLEDKLYEGDGATPEGRFTILQKKDGGQTRFHKALLLNYPTPEHRHRLREAKARGVIQPKQRSGGMIELHGQASGGSDFTSGCIALANHHMDTLYELATPGTLVTVVGTTETHNPVAAQARALEAHIKRRPTL